MVAAQAALAVIALIFAILGGTGKAAWGQTVGLIILCVAVALPVIAAHM